MYSGLKSLVLASAVCLAVLVGYGRAARAMELRSGDAVQVAGTFTDLIAAGGRDVTLSASTTDDIFAGGQSVRVDGARGDHLIASARTLTLRSATMRDIIAAAGEMRLSAGRVEDDLIVGAGVLRAGADFQIGGSLIAGGGDLEVLSPVGGDVWASGETVRLDSAITGSVSVSAQRLILGPNARIGGNLTYSAAKFELMPGAVIVGRRIAQPMPQKPAAPPATVAAAIQSALAGALIFIVGGALLTAAFATACPQIATANAERTGRDWLLSTGVGLLIACASPAALVLLTVSLVGLPLAISLFLVELAAAPLALAVTAYSLGMMLRGRARRGRAPSAPGGWARLLWPLLAIALLGLVGAIPLVGFTIWMLAYLSGLGGLATMLWRSARPGAAALQPRG